MDKRLSGYTVVNGICDGCNKPFAKISTIYRCNCDTMKMEREIDELMQKIMALEAQPTLDNDSKELKSCPFCGGRAEMVRIFGRIGIECVQCNICIRSEEICGEAGYDSIFEAWNKRVEEIVDSIAEWPFQTHMRAKTKEEMLKKLLCLFEGDLVSAVDLKEKAHELQYCNAMFEEVQKEKKECHERISKLTNSVHKLLVEQDKAVDLQIQLTSTEAKLASAVEALENYSEHDVGCLFFMKKNGWTGFECECGLEEAIAQTKKGSEG